MKFSVGGFWIRLCFSIDWPTGPTGHFTPERFQKERTCHGRATFFIRLTTAVMKKTSMFTKHRQQTVLEGGSNPEVQSNWEMNRESLKNLSYFYSK